MSTDLRNVPGLEHQNRLTQTRFWGGADRLTCVQVTQRNPQFNSDTSSSLFNHLQLTKAQARALAVELMLFAEDREVEDDECHYVMDDTVDQGLTVQHLGAILYITIRAKGLHMAYYTYTKDPIGVFVEKDTGNHFEYSVNDTGYFPDAPHKVWVGGEGVAGMWGWRYANVKKTVAYVCVDEDADSMPVIEKWKLKKNTEYILNR